MTMMIISGCVCVYDYDSWEMQVEICTMGLMGEDAVGAAAVLRTSTTAQIHHYFYKFYNN